MTTETAEERTRKDALLERLYGLLTELGMQTGDVIRELRRERIRVTALSQLGPDKLTELVADCERLLDARTPKFTDVVGSDPHPRPAASAESQGTAE